MPNPNGPPPEARIPHQFQIGNPGGPGRPRKRPQSEANDDLLRMEIPDQMLRQLNTIMVAGHATTMQILKKGATWADAIAYGLAKKAVQGDATCAKELRESVEGKSVQRIELQSPEDRGFEVRVTFDLPAKSKGEIEENITDRVIDATVISQVTEDKEE